MMRMVCCLVQLWHQLNDNLIDYLNVDCFIRVVLSRIL